MGVFEHIHSLYRDQVTNPSIQRSADISCLQKNEKAFFPNLIGSAKQGSMLRWTLFLR